MSALQVSAVRAAPDLSEQVDGTVLFGDVKTLWAWDVLAPTPGWRPPLTWFSTTAVPARPAEGTFSFGHLLRVRPRLGSLRLVVLGVRGVH